MIIKTNISNRKKLVKLICEYAEAEQSYLGPPTFAYEVGGFTIDRDGAIFCNSEMEGAGLRDHLTELGYVKPEIENLEISIPINGMAGTELRNLVFILHSKQFLLNRVVEQENFVVSEDLIKTLEANPIETQEDFMNLIKENREKTIRGLTLDDEKATFTFPISNNPDKNRAYAELSALMVAQAKEAKRVKATEQKPENEKYYFRIWLIRLGLGGEGGKASRKVLLEGLKGHTAFRIPEDEEKHKARLLAKKASKQE